MTGRTLSFHVDRNNSSILGLTLAVWVLACSVAPVAGQSYRKQDAAVGGLAGAVIGGIIGHQNDETPEGALIGGAVGAIAGGLLGDAKDQEVARQRYYQQQAWQQHRVVQSQARSRAVTMNDVVNMARSGLSDTVIINQIRKHGVIEQIGTHEIIAMHNGGVSETVISAMQSAPRAGVPQRETVVVERPARPTQVIVHKEYVVPAPPPRRVRYATRPAFPTYPSPHRFRHYW